VWYCKKEKEEARYKFIESQRGVLNKYFPDKSSVVNSNKQMPDLGQDDEDNT
jgi:hypothetical protein